MLRYIGEAQRWRAASATVIAARATEVGPGPMAADESGLLVGAPNPEGSERNLGGAGNVRGSDGLEVVRRALRQAQISMRGSAEGRLRSRSPIDQARGSEGASGAGCPVGPDRL